MAEATVQPQPTTKSTNWKNIFIGIIILAVLTGIGVVAYNSYQSKPLTSNTFIATEKITAEEAIEIANDSLVKGGSELVVGGVNLNEFNISATDILDDTDKKYVETQNPVWKVSYSPKKLQLGGGIIYYVDKTNGEIVGGYLGQ